MINHPLPFKIGCDPEFILESGFPDNIRADSVSRIIDFEANSRYGNLGVDGAGGPIEIRPKASATIPELLVNIKGLLRQAASRIGQFQWKTTSFKMPAGGHIHLQIPVDSTQRQLETLSERLFSFYLPLMLTENLDNLKARTQTSYGHIGDFHSNTFPGRDGSPSERTFELRTPSAEWLTTPKVAAATLAYIATIHNEALNHPETFEQFQAFSLKTREQMRFVEDLSKAQLPIMLDPYLKVIKKALKNFEFYPKFRREIQFILNPQRVLQDKAKANYDILQGWKLNSKAPTKKQLHDLKLIQRQAKKHLTNTAIPVSMHLTRYNEDFKLNRLMTDFHQRAFALCWKLKHKYIFFGLRKSQTETVVIDNQFHLYLGETNPESQKQVNELYTAFRKMTNRFHPQPDCYLVGLPYKLRAGKKGIDRFLDLVQYLEHHLPDQPTKDPNHPKLAGAYQYELSKENTDELIDGTNHEDNNVFDGGYSDDDDD